MSVMSSNLHDEESLSTEENGVYARIPLADVTLAEAADIVEDPSFFVTTRVAILFHFPQVDVEGYWGLSVGDHREFYDYLVGKGLV